MCAFSTAKFHPVVLYTEQQQYYLNKSLAAMCHYQWQYNRHAMVLLDTTVLQHGQHRLIHCDGMFGFVCCCEIRICWLLSKGLCVMQSTKAVSVQRMKRS